MSRYFNKSVLKGLAVLGVFLVQSPILLSMDDLSASRTSPNLRSLTEDYAHTKEVIRKMLTDMPQYAKKADFEAQKDAVNQLRQELTSLNTSFTLLQEILKKEKEDNAKLHTALQREQEKNDKILGQFVGFLEQYKNEKEESAATIETLEKQIRELQDFIMNSEFWL